MASALIGHTGFVGGSLARQHRFDASFNSRSIESIAGRRFDLLVVSGMPAAKWVANRDPLADRAALHCLWQNLERVRAETVVVISTVDVYPVPVGVDEDTLIDPVLGQPYGLHRMDLELLAAGHFSRVLRVRLPGLFGPGLKKNAVYDLLHGNEVHKLHPDAVFQFYNLDRLWTDIGTALKAGLSLVNLVTEPVSLRDVAREAFGQELSGESGTRPARYDVRSKHAELFGGRDGYLAPRSRVLAGLRSFVESQRGAARVAA